MGKKSRVLLITLFFLFFIGILGGAYWRSWPQKQGISARLKVSPLFWDFGTVNYGAVLEKSFSLRNEGKEELIIRKVATSCACTSAEVEKKRLAAGEETELKVKYETGKMSGRHARGLQERIIYLFSNDPQNPQITVKIKANVR